MRLSISSTISAAALFNSCATHPPATLMNIFLTHKNWARLPTENVTFSPYALCNKRLSLTSAPSIPFMIEIPTKTTAYNPSLNTRAGFNSYAGRLERDSPFLFSYRYLNQTLYNTHPARASHEPGSTPAIQPNIQPSIGILVGMRTAVILVYLLRKLGSTPRTKRDTKHITVTSKSFVWESNLVFAHRMRMPPWQYDRWEKEKKKIRQRSPEERM